MHKLPSKTSFNRRESCAGGCLVIFIAVLAIWFALGLLNDARYLKTQPAESDIIGRWHVTEISGPVSHWLAESGNAVRRGTHLETSPLLDEMDAKRKAAGLDHGWIEFLPHAKLTAHALPWLLENDVCYRVSDKGSWELEDVQYQDKMAKWEMQVDLHGTTQNLIFRKDWKGIYLDLPIDWEFNDSVVLRKAVEIGTK